MGPAASHISSIDRLVGGTSVDADQLQIMNSPGFASAFHLDEAALATAGYANLVFGTPTLDGEAVSTVFATPVDIDGQPVPKWATLSGYYDTSTGRPLQLHCNFAHHHAGVVELLGCADSREAVQEAILDWDPVELETALTTNGMIAAYLRTLDEWTVHPHAIATADLPLVTVERIGDGDPRSAAGPTRVLDCSRVLAGPVAGQMFAAHGADVLRVDSPHLPTVPICVIATGAGKRNAFLDLRTTDGAQTMRQLLADADVWIDAYRPGALASHGFDLDRAPEGSVVVQLSAFDWRGPWAGRRGFDSIIQSTTGIVDAGTTAAGAEAPTPLPVQALDYMTGLLAAAAGEKVRQRQRVEGGTWLVRVSLLRTRNWLLSLGGPDPFTPATAAVHERHRTTMDSDFGTLSIPTPLSGSFESPPANPGTSPPRWKNA